MWKALKTQAFLHHIQTLIYTRGLTCFSAENRLTRCPNANSQVASSRAVLKLFAYRLCAAESVSQFREQPGRGNMWPHLLISRLQFARSKVEKNGSSRDACTAHMLPFLGDTGACLLLAVACLLGQNCCLLAAHTHPSLLRACAKVMLNTV